MQGKLARGGESIDIVSAVMSEMLSIFAANPMTDTRELAAARFAQANPSDRHHVLRAVVSALIVKGHSDKAIIAALRPIYASVVPDDANMLGLMRAPFACRRGMSIAVGAPLRSVEDLDAELDAGRWSLFK